MSRAYRHEKARAAGAGHPGQLGGAAGEERARQLTLEILLATFDAKRAAVVTLTLVLTGKGDLAATSLCDSGTGARPATSSGLKLDPGIFGTVSV